MNSVAVGGATQRRAAATWRTRGLLQYEASMGLLSIWGIGGTDFDEKLLPFFVKDDSPGKGDLQTCRKNQKKRDRVVQQKKEEAGKARRWSVSREELAFIRGVLTKQRGHRRDDRAK